MKEKNEHAQALGRIGGLASAKKRWGDKTPEQIKEEMRKMRALVRKVRTPRVETIAENHDTSGPGENKDTSVSAENQA